MFKKYTPINMSLQEDGASCGFWALTFALLLIFNIDPVLKENKQILANIGVLGLKTLWKDIWINWRTDSIGLRCSILQPFLSNFKSWIGFEDKDECVCF